MREALRCLTGRGRAFLAAGVTAVVCAVLLDERALVRVGVLVVALPLATAVVVGRTKYRLALTRAVAPAQVTAGSPARVTLTLVNQGRTPSGVLLLEEQVPYALGARPRFVVDGIGHGWRRSVSYQLRSDVRGRFEVGPMSVRVSDPFGLVELRRTFTATTSLVVTPRTVPLPAIPITGGWTGSGDNRPRAFALGSAEDVTVRGYRQGDDLRRVHWRSSARTGELMVRREEQPWQARATVLLDTRRAAHRGTGAGSSLETAVSAAASICQHLTQRGFSVRLVTTGGHHGQWHDRDVDRDAAALLEALAVVETSGDPRFAAPWLDDAGSGGLTVAVVGHLTPDDQPALRRVRHHAGVALAVAVDVEQYAPRGPHPELSGARAAGLLAQVGWRSAVLGAADPLEPVWQDLGRASARPRVEATS